MKNGTRINMQLPECLLQNWKNFFSAFPFIAKKYCSKNQNNIKTTN
ncbi:hypothetical protein HDC92_004286 [Pedobacter sp. AK017]|nr:hypothetical protein [Pedobacter sp. AK017]